VHVPRFYDFLQVSGENGITQVFHKLRILDRKKNLDAPIEIAGHHVRAPEIDFVFACVAKIENAAVL